MSIDNPLDGPEYPPSHKKLSYYQVARILAAYERGDNVSKLARELAVSIQAASHWRGYAGLSEAWIRRVKGLERRTRSAEARLNRKTYELKCATSIIKEFEPSPKRRSLIATAMRARFNLTRYSANRIVGLSPAAGESRFASKADETLIYVMRRYIDVHPRVGFRSLFSVLLKYKPGTRYRAFQIYKKYFATRKMGRSPRGQRRHAPAGHLATQERLNEVWSMDFMQDALVSGQRFWLFNVIDDFNREAIVVKAIRRRSANAVICELDRLASLGRQPLSIRSDRGGEFRSIAYEKWAARRGVNRLFSRPRVPTDNAYIENFNKAIRREILSEYDFETLNQVQRTMDSWCLYYNYVRPIEILGNMSPLQFAQTATLKKNEN